MHEHHKSKMFIVNSTINHASGFFPMSVYHWFYIPMC